MSEPFANKLLTYFLPIRRFTSKMVFSGFIEAWFLAASPTSLSVSVNATQEGVIREPRSLAMISTRPPLKCQHKNRLFQDQFQ